MHVHVPAQAINTRRPSYAIPHIFHTKNKSSSNQFIYKRIIYDRVLGVHNILPYAFALSKCILISSWLVYYNFTLHVVLNNVNNLYFTIK